MPFTENEYEKAILELFRSVLNYECLHGQDVVRDYSEAVYLNELDKSLHAINFNLHEEAISQAVITLRDLEGGSILLKNRQFMYYIQNGLTVKYFDQGEERSALVNIVDYQNIENNSFLVASQWTIFGEREKRFDIVIFLNGLPIVVMELKSPSREETNASEAYLQLRNYMRDVPSIFCYNAFLVMSDLAVSKAGTITSDEERFFEWKTKDGSYENTQFAQFDTFFEGIFQKERLLDIIKNFICFSGDAKILCAYHQYYAVKKAVSSTVKAVEKDGKAGVFWHTQGSGKSLSMVFYARLLQDALESPTIVVLTDRNDLDDQLLRQFKKCSEFLRQTPEHAVSRLNLRDLLARRQANGIIFTTAQKFEESTECLSERRNIIVIADEAHRSQFIDERADRNTGKIKKSFGLIIRESLPNASYIGFTGTPISTNDRSTIELFGNYIDIYDMTQAVKDGATRPVYYESRAMSLKLDAETMHLIDIEYDKMSAQAEDYAIEKSKRQHSRLETILGADSTISNLCEDIVNHYEQNRRDLLTGKAMIVAYSRTVAMDIYNKIRTLRPEWDETLGIIMTDNNTDPEKWRDIIKNSKFRDDMAIRFKDDESPLKIVIVVDMWLTGFDLPSLATMYIYKQMKGHTLMQAIARVNRVFKDKEGGLIVDYVGIASALKQAMHDYTDSDREKYGDTDISKTAYPAFLEKLEICRDMFHGFDYSAFANEGTTDLERTKIISGGLNFMLALERQTDPNEYHVQTSGSADQSVGYGCKTSPKDAFIKEAMLLRQTLSLCSSIVRPEHRSEAAFFQAVRTNLIRITSPDKPLTVKAINDRIKDLLEASVQSSGVINLFDDNLSLSLFDPKFLEEISKMKEKNLAVELLRKLLSDKVKKYRKTNLVKSSKFSELLAAAMNRYLNGLITNSEVISELLKLAGEIISDAAAGKAMGLNEEEQAFYDALTRPEAIKDFYENDELMAMTHELTDQLRQNRTIDWQLKDSARAEMRRMVRKLLKKHKYPPEGMEYAVDTVIKQCEMWADN
jgi:type I restriction enzyme R subunit